MGVNLEKLSGNLSKFLLLFPDGSACPLHDLFNFHADFFTDELEGKVIEVSLITNHVGFAINLLPQVLNKRLLAWWDWNVVSLDFIRLVGEHVILLELSELFLEESLKLLDGLVLNLELLVELLNELTSSLLLFL